VHQTRASAIIVDETKRPGQENAVWRRSSDRDKRFYIALFGLLPSDGVFLRPYKLSHTSCCLMSREYAYLVAASVSQKESSKNWILQIHRQSPFDRDLVGDGSSRCSTTPNLVMAVNESDDIRAMMYPCDSAMGQHPLALSKVPVRTSPRTDCHLQVRSSNEELGTCLGLSANESSREHPKIFMAPGIAAYQSPEGIES
jgi:hypothetical protein